MVSGCIEADCSGLTNDKSDISYDANYNLQEHLDMILRMAVELTALVPEDGTKILI